MTFRHTPQTDARIRHAYANGERISDVAAELGCTRNVIIGRACRLGLNEPGRQLRASATAEARKKLSESLRDNWANSPERRIEMSIRVKRMHREDPEVHRRIVDALHEGRDRYYANREAYQRTKREAAE